MSTNGLPTRESLNSLMGALSQRAGHGGPAEGAYFVNDRTADMNRYMADRMGQTVIPTGKTIRSSLMQTIAPRLPKQPLH
jgi:hypothetical protein